MARKQKPQRGLRIDVKNNNVDIALRKFKKMVFPQQGEGLDRL